MHFIMSNFISVQTARVLHNQFMQTFSPNNQNAHHSITFTKTAIVNIIQSVQNANGIRFYIGIDQGKLSVFGVPVVGMGNVRHAGPLCNPGSDAINPGFVVSGGHIEEITDFESSYSGCGGSVNNIQNTNSPEFVAIQQYQLHVPGAFQQLLGHKARAFDIADLVKIFNDPHVDRIRIFFGIEIPNANQGNLHYFGNFFNMLIIGADNQGNPVRSTPPNEAGPVLAISIPCPIHCDRTSFLCI